MCQYVEDLGRHYLVDLQDVPLQDLFLAPSQNGKTQVQFP